MIEMGGTKIEVLDEHPMTELPAAGHLMTVVVSVAPHDPGTPAHRHSGPVYGYVLEGEMLFELEGDAPVVKKVGDTIWEPGGDRIHYQAANPGDVELRFVVVMACKEGEEMLTFVPPEELESRKHLRHPSA
ncbi:MAG: cupin domain-containing protein [Pseudonocardiaceae bacterium]|nr:MAG: cupin domain-containing protein [Pseudonocardiaceae bacterium]